MLNHRIHRGEGGTTVRVRGKRAAVASGVLALLVGKATARGRSAARLLAVLCVAALVCHGLGGCVQAEKARYMRHLTTIVEPSRDIPDDVVVTFDIDRKRVAGAVAANVVD